MHATGYISEIHPGEGFYAFIPFAETHLLDRRQITEIEARIDDGRIISADQRKKVYATLRDIGTYTGHTPDEVKALMKYDHIAKTGCDYFSLSDCSMTTANEFLSHLLDFCVEWDIPTADRLLSRSPDISRAVYACLIHKRCVICGKPAQLHHVDRIGMGRDRREITHEGMRAQPLCGGVRGHHDEAHSLGQKTFDDKYHVYGIRIDRELCRIWKVKAGDG